MSAQGVASSVQLQSGMVAPTPRPAAGGDALRIGRIIGPWRLEKRLGVGGFGEVWAAEPASADAPPPLRTPASAGAAPGNPPAVALKIALRPEGRDALLREVEISRRVQHPHIVRVLDTSLHAEPPYIVVERCSLGSLRSVLGSFQIGGGWPALVEAHAWVTSTGLQQVAQALAAAHAAGVVHGDLKPENILVHIEKAELVCKVADFGLGAVLEAETDGVALSRSLASTTEVGGTLAYIAPERLRGAPPSPAGDVWSFGLVLFECHHGRLPVGYDVLDGMAAWREGHLFSRCYLPAEKRLPDGAALVEAYARGAPGSDASPVGIPRAAKVAAPALPRPASSGGGPRPRLRGSQLLGIAALALCVGTGLVGAALQKDGGRGGSRRYGFSPPTPAPSAPTPAPSAPAPNHVEGILRDAAIWLATLGGEGPGGSAREAQAKAAVENAMARAESIGYKLAPRVADASVRAMPRYGGWPTYVLSANGVFSEVPAAASKVVRR